MITEKDIDREIQALYDKFRDSPYEGELPIDLLEYFRMALMELPPAQHKYNLEKVKEIISKNIDELTNLEVGMVINLILEMPFGRLFDTLEEGIDYHIRLNDVRNKYNTMINSKSNEIEKVRQMKFKLSGITRNTTKFN